jgi:hypothetical protein
MQSHHRAAGRLIGLTFVVLYITVGVLWGASFFIDVGLLLRRPIPKSPWDASAKNTAAGTVRIIVSGGEFQFWMDNASLDDRDVFQRRVLALDSMSPIIAPFERPNISFCGFTWRTWGLRFGDGSLVDNGRAVSREASVQGWLLITAFAVPLMFATLRCVKRLSRRWRNCCENCGYDLRASPGRCPECGVPSRMNPTQTPGALSCIQSK